MEGNSLLTSPPLAVLLGTAVGDSLGLPAENLSARRIRNRWQGPWKHRFFFGRGMVSDDTEHTVFAAQCLIGQPDAGTFQRRLAWKLRWWLLCLPAGIGFATLRAILKLWLGFPPGRSGVYSAGNGPAMRSALLGVVFANDVAAMREYVSASTHLTHIDPKARTAAMAVALTAAWSVRGQTATEASDLRQLWLSADPEDTVWAGLVDRILDAHRRKLSVTAFAHELGLEKGVTGYAYHTVPMALYAWLNHHGDFRAGLEAVIFCGGDTDTAGAITGALLALTSPIPEEWLDGLCDYPISRTYLDQLASALDSHSLHAPVFAWLLLPVRNLFFLGVIFAHLFGRIFLSR